MNLRQIEAFRAVMIRGTMTAAAHDLRTSQPSISRLIAELEDAIQIKLFERKAGRVTPTDEGSAFYREVEHSFAGLEHLAQAARDIRLFGTGRLRVASMPALALGFLPRVIRRFKNDYPNVTISLQMRSEATVTRWTSAHYCDVGFVANFHEAAGVDAQRLYRLTGVCALPPGHKFARKKVLRPVDLADEPFISHALGDGARLRMDDIFEHARIPRKLVTETPYGATICALVAQDIGVGIVNPIVAADHKRSGLRFIRFKPDVMFEGYILLPVHRQSSVIIDSFIKIAQEMIAEEFNGFAPGGRD